MCKKRTAGSHSSAESEIVSLGMDGLAALQFWGCALETLSSKPAKRNLERHNIYHDRSWKLVTLWCQHKRHSASLMRRYCAFCSRQEKQKRVNARVTTFYTPASSNHRVFKRVTLHCHELVEEQAARCTLVHAHQSHSRRVSMNKLRRGWIRRSFGQSFGNIWSGVALAHQMFALACEVHPYIGVSQTAPQLHALWQLQTHGS